MDTISIRGAREHNLKGIDLDLPRNRLIVVTGLSGSGKSSLAFDTLYAEGQRRYVESLSAYARQFLEQMEKPQVDSIEGLSPAISIEQKSVGSNPRSTVGTITEIYDYLRLLYARVGRPHCPQCGKPIASQTVQQMADRILGLPDGTKVQVLAPVVRGRKGEYGTQFQKWLRMGYVRARVDGRTVDLDAEIRLDKNRKHEISLVIDRLVVRAGIAGRLAEALEQAVRLADGVAVAEVSGQGDLLFSERLACLECGTSLPEMAPRSFSFNSPYGACPECTGLGSRWDIDPEKVVPEPGLSIGTGALAPWGRGAAGYLRGLLSPLRPAFELDVRTPWKDLPSEMRAFLLHGSGASRGEGLLQRGSFEGILKGLEKRYRETDSESVRGEIEKFMSQRPCTACGGKRLRPESLSVRVGGRDIAEVCRLSVEEAGGFFGSLPLDERERAIGDRILKEIRERLGFLRNVGLGYLEIDRGAATLSGGEGQRIRLATQIGSRLMGVLYVLDEPSIGLHPRDNRKLLDTLLGMRDLGNTIVVVEHDEETIRSADWIVDLGPGAGIHGGEIVAQGPLKAILAHPASLTGRYLSGRAEIETPSRRRTGSGAHLVVRGAAEHNLKGIDVSFPLGTLIAVTGVSGSGKSTLVNEILYRALARRLHGAMDPPGAHRGIEGLAHLDKVIEVTQAPIGRTPRSNPATYTGLFGEIRDLFARVPESRARGYSPGRFSFNVKGGRCESCEGDGVLRIEMHFLPDVYVTCEACRGKRYNRETLEIRYKEKNIAEVLDLSVAEALEFFERIPRLRERLETLHEVGLDYIKLGQPATTLSGGEAQRIKLSRELGRRATGRTLYILDEPTTGLHFEDVRRLLLVLHSLVEQGNTVVVIEHHLDVIKTADYIIDLGPEGGAAGGEVVACGTPEQVARATGSSTGRCLRERLRGSAVLRKAR